PHLGRGAPLPAGAAAREARQPAAVLHGEVLPLGGAAVPRLLATRALGTLSAPGRARPALGDGRVLRGRRARPLRTPRLLSPHDATLAASTSRADLPVRPGRGGARRRRPRAPVSTGRGLGDHRAAARHLPREPPHRTARRAALRRRPGGGSLELGATAVPGSADRLGMVVHLSGRAAGAV